jgi:two-component system NarL family sensor kinase
MPPDFKYYLISFLIAFLFLGLFIILLATLYSKKQQKNKNEKRELQLQFQQALLQTQLEIQEQTFKNISQEIHDNIGQALTLAKLNLNTMPDVTDTQKEKLITTKEIVSKTINDLRDLSRSMNTDHIAQLGLQKAIEYELALVSRSSAIHTSFSTTGDPWRPDQQKELILFRIVQEILNNAMKHAEASTITGAIIYSEQDLILILKDDGKGFDAAEISTKESGGLGVRNMHNRVALIEGKISIHSSTQSGTEINISLPK